MFGTKISRDGATFMYKYILSLRLPLLFGQASQAVTYNSSNMMKILANNFLWTKTPDGDDDCVVATRSNLSFGGKIVVCQRFMWEICRHNFAKVRQEKMKRRRDTRVVFGRRTTRHFSRIIPPTIRIWILSLYIIRCEFRQFSEKLQQTPEWCSNKV